MINWHKTRLLTLASFYRSVMLCHETSRVTVILKAMTATNLAKLGLKHRDSVVKLQTEGARANISIRFESICGGNPVLPRVISPQ